MKENPNRRCGSRPMSRSYGPPHITKRHKEWRSRSPVANNQTNMRARRQIHSTGGDIAYRVTMVVGSILEDPQCCPWPMCYTTSTQAEVGKTMEQTNWSHQNLVSDLHGHPVFVRCCPRIMSRPRRGAPIVIRTCARWAVWVDTINARLTDEPTVRGQPSPFVSRTKSDCGSGEVRNLAQR